MPPDPKHGSGSTSLQGYLRAWNVIFDLKKEKPPFFFCFLGLLPPDPLVKCECIYICTNVRIWIDLGEKYSTNFGLLFIYYPKNC